MCNHKPIHAYYDHLTSVSGAAPSPAQYWHELRQEVEKVRKWSEEAFCPRQRQRLVITSSGQDQDTSCHSDLSIICQKHSCGEAVQVLCSCAGVPNNCHNIVNTSDKLSAVTPLEMSTGLRKISRLVNTMFKRLFTIVS